MIQLQFLFYSLRGDVTFILHMLDFNP